MRKFTLHINFFKASTLLLLASTFITPSAKAEVSYLAELIASNHQIGNMLQWTTGFESNSQLFLVEKSKDGLNFKEVGNIPGAGESEDIKTYKFLDFETNKDIAYYRLKQVDFDGTFSYSESIKTENSFTNQLMVMGIHITENEFEIKLDSRITGQLNCFVTNAKGEKVIEKEIKIISGLNEVIVDLSNEDIGVYKITMQMEDELEQMTIRKTTRDKKRNNVALKKVDGGGK